MRTATARRIPLWLNPGSDADEIVHEISSMRVAAGVDRVRWIQQALNQILRLNLAIDGIVGPQTRGAILRFQAQNGLAADGIVGPQTERALRAALSGSSTSPPASLTPPLPPAQPGTDWSRVSPADRMRYVMNLLTGRYGYPINAAAGLVGNLFAESGLIPSRLEGSHESTPLRARDFQDRLRDFTPEEVMQRDFRARRGPKLPGVGLAQWTFPSRRVGLFRHTFQGRPSGPGILFDMDAQVDYLVTELRTSYQSVNRTLTHPGVNVDGASDDVLFRFERPAVVIDRPRGDPAVQQVIQTRRRYARQALSAGQTALSPRRITIPPVVIVAPAATLTHFAFDRADLTARHHTQLRQVAARIARSWQAGSPVHTVNLVGHTDPVGSVAYNRSLGQRRGLAARAALVRSLEEQQRGLGSRVLILVNSKGEQEAVNADPGSNRRVEVFLSTRRLRSPRPLSPPRPVPPVLDSEPPPSPPLTACDRVALERLVDRCIRDSRGCVEQAITSMTLALRRNPIDNIRAGAAFLLALRRCREALLECDRRAKQDTGCTR